MYRFIRITFDFLSNRSDKYPEVLGFVLGADTPYFFEQLSVGKYPAFIYIKKLRMLYSVVVSLTISLFTRTRRAAKSRLRSPEVTTELP